MCVGVTLGSDDLINIPACKANLLHSEGCSYDGATHEGDTGEWAGGVVTHPSSQMHLNEYYMHARAYMHKDTCVLYEHVNTVLILSSDKDSYKLPW